MEAEVYKALEVCSDLLELTGAICGTNGGAMALEGLALRVMGNRKGSAEPTVEDLVLLVEGTVELAQRWLQLRRKGE